MRKLFAVVILLCTIYFIGGWFAVKFGLVIRDDYFAYAGIVGGFASVVGLLALTRSPISQSDFKAIELDTLRSMTDTAEQLKKLQSEHARTAQELGNLEVKKKEMELLVKKASLALFLKEQYTYHERQVLEEVMRNAHLRKALDSAVEASAKIAALDEEIAVDPHVKQLREIIEASTRREPTLDEALKDLPTITRMLILFTRLLSRSLFDVVKIIR